MSGFFRHDGVWVQREEGVPIGGQQQAFAAIGEALARVHNGVSMAGVELRELLLEYPLLKQELKDKQGEHPLAELARLHAGEAFTKG